MLLTFVSYKHSQPGNTVAIRVNSSPPYCPVSALQSFLHLRGSVPSPLFMGPDKSPLNRSDFARYLRQSLIWAGLHHSRYTPHSFHIGAATDADQSGIPDTKIWLMGRWRWWWYHSLMAHQHQKGHTVPKQVIMIATSIEVATV